MINRNEITIEKGAWGSYVVRLGEHHRTYSSGWTRQDAIDDFLKQVNDVARGKEVILLTEECYNCGMETDNIQGLCDECKLI